jgi:hypothetical protein
VANSPAFSLSQKRRGEYAHSRITRLNEGKGESVPSLPSLSLSLSIEDDKEQNGKSGKPTPHRVRAMVVQQLACASAQLMRRWAPIRGNLKQIGLLAI